MAEHGHVRGVRRSTTITNASGDAVFTKYLKEVLLAPKEELEELISEATLITTTSDEYGTTKTLQIYGSKASIHTENIIKSKQNKHGILSQCLTVSVVEVREDSCKIGSFGRKTADKTFASVGNESLYNVKMRYREVNNTIESLGIDNPKIEDVEVTKQ